MVTKYSLYKYFLRAYCVPGIVLATSKTHSTVLACTELRPYMLVVWVLDAGTTVSL